jgi:hypothetical protein
MSTQLLFGDLFEILEISGPWLKIKNHYDDYEGWIDFKQITFLEEEEFQDLLRKPFFVNRHHMLDFMANGAARIHLPAGCSIILNEEGRLNLRDESFDFHGSSFPFAFNNILELITTAEGYLYCPYLWGGKTCLGLDCSGFTQIVYKQHGIRLLRDAIQQSAQGELINLLSEGLPGDLAFFDHDNGIISHVGILLDQSRIIHCSGRVRIDPIDHYGIYNTDLKKYTHALRLIRRVV